MTNIVNNIKDYFTNPTIINASETHDNDNNSLLNNFNYNNYERNEHNDGSNDTDFEHIGININGDNVNNRRNSGNDRNDDIRIMNDDDNEYDNDVDGGDDNDDDDDDHDHDLQNPIEIVTSSESSSEGFVFLPRRKKKFYLYRSKFIMRRYARTKARFSKQLTPTTPVTASINQSISPHPKSSSAVVPVKNEIPEKEKKRKELSSSRQKKFHRHFQQVSKDERVINYFSCALVSDILLQGHLYITEQHFAFYSNVFGFVTKLLIPTASVIKISKEKTAKIIPNAVGVATADERHVFGSFMSREAAFRLMCSVCAPLEPIENIPVKVPDIEVSEEYSVEDDSSCSISGNESPPQLIDSTATTTSTSDASQTVRQRKIPAIEAPNITNIIITSDTVDGGKSEDIPDSAKTILTTPVSCSSSSTPVKLSKSPPPRIVSSPYTIKIKFPTDFHIVYLGLVLTIVLALLSGFLLYRILDIEAKTSYRNSLDFNWDSDTDEDVYAKALKWQKEMQTKSTEEAQSILNTNLEQIAKVRRSLETLSLLIHDKNIPLEDDNNNRGYVQDDDINLPYDREEST